MNILGHEEDGSNKESFLPVRAEFPAHNIFMVIQLVLLCEPCKYSNQIQSSGESLIPKHRKVDKSQFTFLVHSNYFIKEYFPATGMTIPSVLLLIKEIQISITPTLLFSFQVKIGSSLCLKNLFFNVTVITKDLVNDL